MLDRQHGEVVFECDSCGETLTTGEDEFAQAMQLFRREGWRAVKDDEDDTWQHYCMRCKTGK